MKPGGQTREGKYRDRPCGPFHESQVNLLKGYAGKPQRNISESQVSLLKGFAGKQQRNQYENLYTSKCDQ